MDTHRTQGNRNDQDDIDLQDGTDQIGRDNRDGQKDRHSQNGQNTQGSQDRQGTQGGQDDRDACNDQDGQGVRADRANHDGQNARSGQDDRDARNDQDGQGTRNGQDGHHTRANQDTQVDHDDQDTQNKDAQAVIERIEALKRERDAVILAHYYVSGDVQDAADYVGDSFYLSKIAAQLDNRVIVFAGVQFMGESAKLLSPDKTVILPEPAADCPMAHMVRQRDVENARAQYDDLAVVCYVNSTAQTKAWSDVCVTSSNALRVVQALPNRHILFIPDKNLGSWLAQQLPDKEFHLIDGFCPIHETISLAELENLAFEYPNAPLLVHPECPDDVVRRADYVGSTSGIIDAAVNGTASDYIIGTVHGVAHAIERRTAGSGKRLHFPATTPTCVNMSMVTLDKVLDALEGRVEEVQLPEPDVAQGARAALSRMLELSK